GRQHHMDRGRLEPAESEAGGRGQTRKCGTWGRGGQDDEFALIRGERAVVGDDDAAGRPLPLTRRDAVAYGGATVELLGLGGGEHVQGATVALTSRRDEGPARGCVQCADGQAPWGQRTVYEDVVRATLMSKDV